MGSNPSKPARICSSCGKLAPLLERAARTRCFVTPDLRTADVHPGGYDDLDIGIKIGDWRLEDKQRDCALCNMFQASMLTNDSTEIRAFSLLHSLLSPSDYFGHTARGRDFLDWARKDIPYDSSVLVVVPDDFAFRKYRHEIGERAIFDGRYLMCHDLSAQPSPGNRALLEPTHVPRYFTPGTAKPWIEYCVRKHGPCSRLEDVDFLDFELIDCITRRIVPAERAIRRNQPIPEYVALSYVWGKTTKAPPKEQASRKVLPTSSLPRVVSDALLFTKGLGFRYLWVDQYCIDQYDEDKKHGQIQRMNVIYRNAVVTLIAAAEDGQDEGPAGINPPRRTGQRAVVVNNVLLMSPLRPVQDVVRQSRWATRGWTYQEAFLSRRRLIFTRQEVYFECEVMNCRESVSMLLPQAHVANGREILPFLTSGMFGMAQLAAEMRRKRTSWISGVMLDRERAWLMLISCIKEYTARELTYASDSLNAFVGVLRQFETSLRFSEREGSLIASSNTPMRHVWGVPFVTTTAASESTPMSVDPVSLFVCGLCWYHTHAPTVVVQRRPDFPSWSWCGWSGAVDGCDDPIEFHRQAGDVLLENPNSSRISPVKYAQQPWHRFAQQPRIIVLNTYAVPNDALTISTPSTTRHRRSKIPIDIFGAKGELFLDDPDIALVDITTKNVDVPIELVVLGTSTISQSSYASTFLLVILWEEGGLACSRIGAVRVHHWGDKFPFRNCERRTFRIK